MSEKHKPDFLRRVESVMNNSKTKAIFAIAILGLVLAGCSPKSWSTTAPREVKVIVEIEDNLEVNINPELSDNTMLRVVDQDGGYVNLSDNIAGIPGTIESVDIASGDLVDKKFESTLYVKGEGYTDEKKCNWAKDSTITVEPGTIVAILRCE